MNSCDPLGNVSKWCIIIAGGGMDKPSLTAAQLISELPVPVEYAALSVCLWFCLG